MAKIVSYFSVEHAPIIVTKQKIQRSFAESETVPRILFEEKAQELLAKDEMLQVIPAILDNCRLLSHLLMFFDSLYCKQYRLRLDCS